MIIFFVLLTLGFIFELGKNALSIDSKQTKTETDTETDKKTETISYGDEQSLQSNIYLENSSDVNK